MHPGLLLLDEPTANLDPEGVKEVHDAVRDVLDRTHETLVVVEHHIDVWLDLVDRVIVLGKPESDSHVSGVIADGTPEEVFGSMAPVLTKGGAWVPGRTVESHIPESNQSSGNVVLRTEDLSFGREFALGEHVNLAFHARRDYRPDRQKRRGKIHARFDFGWLAQADFRSGKYG